MNKPLPSDAQPLQSLSYSQDPATGQAVLEINGHSIRLLSAQHLDTLLAVLGKLRSEMRPAHPDDVPPLDPQQPHPTLDRIRLATHGDVPAILGGALLSVRSSFYGWQSIELHPEGCRELAEDLMGEGSPHGRPPGVLLN